VQQLFRIVRSMMNDAIGGIHAIRAYSQSECVSKKSRYEN